MTNINENIFAINETTTINNVANELLLKLGFRLDDVLLAANLEEDAPEVEEVEDYLLANDPGRYSWLDERGIDKNLLNREEWIAEQDEYFHQKRQTRAKWLSDIKGSHFYLVEVEKYESDVVVEDSNGERLIEQILEDYKVLNEEDFHDTKAWEKYQSWARRMKTKAETHKASVRALDESFCEEEEFVDTSMPSNGKKWETYLQMYVDRMSLGQLAVAADVLEDEHKAKEISWYYYLLCAKALYGRLWKFTGFSDWMLEFKRVKKAWDTNIEMTKHLCPGNEDRFYGTMSFDMEGAIDKMREVRELAKLNHRTEESMWCELVDDRNTTIENFQGDQQDLIDDDEFDKAMEAMIDQMS